MNTASKKIKRERRHARIRSTIKGTADRPRLSIFKSNAEIYAQLIDDVLGKTVAHSSSKEVKSGTLKERSVEAGKLIAKRAGEKGVKQAVFDRGGFAYKGIIVALADGARDNGLSF